MCLYVFSWPYSGKHYNLYMTLLFVARNIAFIVFFTLIGTRYLSFIPIFVGLLAFLYSSEQDIWDAMWTVTMKHFFLRHAFAFAWVCMMFGGRGIADILGAQTWLVSLWLVWINIFLWIFSYAIEYDDGKEMFHMWYWIASFIALGTTWSIVDNISVFAEITMSWIALTMWLYAFIVFIWNALGKKVKHTMTYPLFILFTLSMMFLMHRRTQNDTVLSLVLSQILLMAMYCMIRWIYWYKDQLEDEPLEANTAVLKRILAWKTLLKKKTTLPFQDDIIHDAYAFLAKLDDTTKFIISFFNIALILGQVYMFVINLWSDAVVFQEIVLWFGIVAFFVNYLLLRQIWFSHSMQRVVAFLLINFGIYLTIVNIFGTDPVYLVWIWTIWSVVNSMVMFHTWWLEKRGILEPRDYTYWIGANLLVTAVNLYVMFLLPLSLQLRFFLALMYFWVQLFLTLYNIRHTSSTSVFSKDIKYG